MDKVAVGVQLNTVIYTFTPSHASIVYLKISTHIQYLYKKYCS